MEAATMTKPIRFVKTALLKKRLDAVVDKLGLNCDQWGKLCRVMLPEEFKAPSKRPNPTPILPGPARVNVYQQRVERNESLFDFSDEKHPE